MIKRYKIWLLALLFIFVASCNNEEEIIPPDTNTPFDEQLYLDETNFYTYDEIEGVQRGKYRLFNPYKDKGSLILKGSMHNHTTNSDGIYSPYFVGLKIKNAGFDFYTITDHNVVTLDPQVDGIVWMGKAMEDTRYEQHMCVYNLPTKKIDFLFGEVDKNVLIDNYHKHGSLVNYAHADWNPPGDYYQYQTNDIILEANRMAFVEVFSIGRINSERAYNLLLSKGYTVFALGTDDFHGDYQFNKSWIVVYGDEKEKESIWAAILRGSFYASNRGGEMDIECVDGVIRVKCQTPSRFYVIGYNESEIGTGKLLYYAKDSKEIEYKIKGDEKYLYVKTIQGEDAIAISQPFIIKN